MATGDFVFQNIILHHPPPPPGYSFIRVSILLVLFVLILYPITYFCRTQHCKVCSKKLILFVDRCYICRFVEAEPPNELILKALEEKGLHMQGELPEAIPGLTKATKNLWERTKASTGKLLAYFKRSPKVAIEEVFPSKQPPVEVTDEELHEKWLEEIYNFQGSLEKSHTKKKPTLVVSGGEQAGVQQKRKPGVRIDDFDSKISSVSDQKLLDTKLSKNEIDQYVIYKAINHPFPPPQPLGLGKQNRNWKLTPDSSEEAKAFKA